MGVCLRSPKDTLKTIKLQTWIWNFINICIIKPLFTQVLRKPKGVLTQCVHILTHLDVYEWFFPLGNQLTPPTHEPAITKMLNIEERRKLIPGLKQKSHRRQSVCETSKGFCLRKSGLLHKVSKISHRQILSGNLPPWVWFRDHGGSKFFRNFAAFIFAPLAPHVLQG